MSRANAASAVTRIALALSLAGCASHTAGHRASPSDTAVTGCTGHPPAAAAGKFHFGDLEVLPRALSWHVVAGIRYRTSRAVWPRTNFSRHLVPLYDFLAGGPLPDWIPPLDHPRVVSAASGDRYLHDDEPVLAVAIGGDARAYPIRIMLWHEIANDVLDGRPIAVTYCPLCNSGVVFDRRVDGRTLRFGTSGLLRRSDLVMWDSATESWWQQYDGLALVGQLAGERLRMLPAEMLSWGEFKRRYPHGDVLTQATGFDRPYGVNPYLGYDTGTRPFAYNGDRVDERLAPMERVLAIQADGRMLAAPYSLLCHRPVVNASLGSVPVAIFYQPAVRSPLDGTVIDSSRDAGTAVAFDRRLGRRTLTFAERHGEVVDLQTGSVWDTSGIAFSGPLRGRALRPLLQNSQFWFALAAFAPNTPILSAARSRYA